MTWFGDSLLWYAGTLDGLPDVFRALVAAGLLLALLGIAGTRVSSRDLQFHTAFGKISLIALVAVPAVVWLLPVSRVAVLVEELDAAVPALNPVLACLVLLWAGGFLVCSVRLAAVGVSARAVARRLPVLPDDDPLVARLEHWRRRLGLTGPRKVALAEDLSCALAPTRRVILPRAAAHWPAPLQDFVIIRALVRNKKHQTAWRSFSALVACAYWPAPWVTRWSAGLQEDLEVVADHLAGACYQDELGYGRALRQMAQRMADPRGGAAGGGGEAAAGTVRRALAVWRAHLAELWSPGSVPDWDVRRLTRTHDRRRAAVWAEPGEKLAFLVGQAVLVALIAGGLTLKQAPPEAERDYLLMLDDSWMSTAFRDPDRYARPAGPGGGEFREHPE